MTSNHVANVIPLVQQPSTPLPTQAGVAVIGGGVMGISIAFHLAQAGVSDIVVIERDTLGSGSSAKPLGGVRATFSDPGNITLGQRSLEAYERFDEAFQTDIGLHQVGYLFLCRSDEELSNVEESTRIQHSLGGSGRLISPAEAHELNPFLNTDCLVGASFSPRDGYAEPAKVVRAYAQAARQLGVTICEHTEVIEMVPAGASHSIQTNRGRVTADTIIIAAGAWSTRLGAMIGEHLPIEAVRRQIGLTPQRATPYQTVPFTLDLSTTLYFHNYRNGMLLGISNPDELPGYGREFSYHWQADFDRAASIVAPSLTRQPLEAGWAGLYENTPDHNAMIGKSERVGGVFYATGFSGHGFLQAPAVGELVRDLYLGRDSFMDSSPFSADRFAGTQATLNEVHII